MKLISFRRLKSVCTHRDCGDRCWFGVMYPSTVATVTCSAKQCPIWNAMHDGFDLKLADRVVERLQRKVNDG